MKDRVVKDIGAKGTLQDWSEIDWQSVKKRVKNLRQRIYRATEQGQYKQAHSLKKLMLRSYSNLLLSVKRVTQENKGKKTAGIDGQRVLKAEERVKIIHQMQEYTLWKVKPTKRIYISKANGKQRPLGIACITDRIAQAMIKNALEPSWEARFEANSYGFRPGRSCQDAISQCFKRLKKGGDTWVLNADIRGAFDNICHDFILKKLGNTPGRELIRQWLKAGYIEEEVFYKTDSGTPQGSICSPLLANIALDGLEKILANYHKLREYTYRQSNGNQRIERKRLKRYGYIRYADDMIVTAEKKEDLQDIIPIIEQWLAKRGLQLNKEKTKIIRVSEGFDFLGFHIRQFHGRCFTLPQKEKALSFLASMRSWLKANIGAKPEAIIYTFNSLLRGWGNYYRHGVSKKMFNYIDHQVWKMLYGWARKRHPNKGKYWVAKKYFMPLKGQRWIFNTTIKTPQGHQKPFKLIRLHTIPIERHIKVAGTASPDNPQLKSYWAKRQTQYGKSYWSKGSKLRYIADRQKWQCPICEDHLFNGEELQIHHIIPVKDNGSDRAENLIHLHKTCHQDLHRKDRLYKLQEA